MKRSSGRKTATGRGPQPPSGRGRHALPRLLVAAALVALAAILSWFASDRRGTRTANRAETLPPYALLDSTKAAERDGDWERAVRWWTRLAATDPADPMLLMGLGLARHNLVWMGPKTARARSATRTSLDRIEQESQVLALLDSALARTRTPEEWAKVRRWSGMIYENLVLPMDAMQVYTDIRVRVPEFQPSLERATALLRFLRDPQTWTAADSIAVTGVPGEAAR